jgi:hypothetical protein
VEFFLFLLPVWLGVGVGVVGGRRAIFSPPLEFYLSLRENNNIYYWKTTSEPQVHAIWWEIMLTGRKRGK